MKTFAVEDLQERSNELVEVAKAGELAVVTMRGSPVFVAVPFDDLLLEEGVHVALAARLFDEESISLSHAARIAGRSVREMMDLLGRVGIPVIRTTSAELKQSLSEFS